MPVRVHIVVVDDPDRLGGFPCGATFTPEEMRQMLLRRALTPGTKLRIIGCWRRCGQELRRGLYMYDNHDLIRIRG